MDIWVHKQTLNAYPGSNNKLWINHDLSARPHTAKPNITNIENPGAYGGSRGIREGGIIEEAPGGGIMEKAFWRTPHGGSMLEASWGGPMEEASWRREAS